MRKRTWSIEEKSMEHSGKEHGALRTRAWSIEEKEHGALRKRAWGIEEKRMEH